MLRLYISFFEEVKRSARKPISRYGIGSIGLPLSGALPLPRRVIGALHSMTSRLPPQTDCATMPP